jgi:hypothetical protein
MYSGASVRSMEKYSEFDPFWKRSTNIFASNFWEYFKDRCGFESWVEKYLELGVKPLDFCTRTYAGMTRDDSDTC